MHDDLADVVRYLKSCVDFAWLKGSRPRKDVHINAKLAQCIGGP